MSLEVPTKLASLPQFFGMVPAVVPSAEQVAKLAADLAAHMAGRPVMPWPLPPVISAEYQAWHRANTSWVDEKFRLECLVEQAQGARASAWKPCDPPAYALALPLADPNAPPPPRRRGRPARVLAPAAGIVIPPPVSPAPASEPAQDPLPGAQELTGSLQQGGIVQVGSGSPPEQESLSCPDSSSDPAPPAETKPRRGSGRPAKNPDDPKSIARRAQYRAAKERARLRSGVIR